MNVLKMIYLNIMFYVLFVLFSVVIIPLLTLCGAFIALFLSHRSAMRRFRRAISWYGNIVIRVLPFPLIQVRYKDYGKNDVSGAYLFICNHRSASDPFLMACLPNECIQVVNIWPFRIPVLGIFARFAGYLSVNELSIEEFSRRVVDLLKEGVSIIVFPEGTRSGSKQMGNFHSSIFRIALQSRCPIVPICISGNENIPLRGSLILHPGIIKVHKLPALQWEKYKDLKPFKLKNKVRDIIARELAIMDGEE